MAKIRTTVEPDLFGEGYKKEIIMDNGDKYKIQTTMEPDLFGEGYKKEIVRSNGLEYDLISILAMFVTLAITATVFIGGAFLIFKLMGY